MVRKWKEIEIEPDLRSRWSAWPMHGEWGKEIESTEKGRAVSGPPSAMAGGINRSGRSSCTPGSGSGALAHHTGSSCPGRRSRPASWCLDSRTSLKGVRPWEEWRKDKGAGRVARGMAKPARPQPASRERTGAALFARYRSCRFRTGECARPRGDAQVCKPGRAQQTSCAVAP